MSPSLEQTDLHVHTIGCYHPDDLFRMARHCYREINWNRFRFLERYEQVFGVRLDPVAMFDRASSSGSLDEISDVAIYRYHPKGRFEEFDVKSFFAIALSGYFLDRGELDLMLSPVLERHKSEGLAYVEYRNAFGAKGEEFKYWHSRYARCLKAASTEDFKPKYIIRMDGRNPIECYLTLREMLDENPDLLDTIVGMDFSGKEIPPQSLASFYELVRTDNEQNPKQALEVVVHIGENFFDLSLESAIRWCHESGLLGAKRLAHCIALGMDPRVATRRRNDAHQREPVKERLCQISYDLAHAEGLRAHGVSVDATALQKEREQLSLMGPDEPVCRGYDARRLNEAAGRQDYVLWDLARLGTVIEVCPTSNLCIGGVPGIEYHPFKKLFASKANLAICTDDPGIFGITLSQEVANVSRWFGITRPELTVRLGDPHKFRLSSGRT